MTTKRFLAGVAVIVLMLPVFATGQTNGNFSVSCSKFQCYNNTWGLGTGPVENECRLELESKCQSQSYSRCSPQGAGWSVGNVSISTKIEIDVNCQSSGVQGYRATGTGTCYYLCDSTSGGDGGGTDLKCEWCSPLIIDLGEKGLDLTAAADGVRFDIDADDLLDSIAWTSSASSDAFLAMDRNLNGSIDSGAELFGDATLQPESDTPNGFLALAEFDTLLNGGNADGMISPADAVWSNLLLWTDSSHDGISQNAELRSPAEAGLDVILLAYKTAERRDRYDNRFRYRSRALIQGATRTIDIFDVFFVRAP